MIATQNPIEQEGTYPLPEAQLDRFLFKVPVGYPTHEQERDDRAAARPPHRHAAARRLRPRRPSPTWRPVQAARAAVAALRLSDPIVDYVVDLVRATRQHASLLCGASPRAASMLAAAARARAALDGRDFVIPDDVKQLAAPGARAPRGAGRPAPRSRG